MIKITEEQLADIIYKNTHEMRNSMATRTDYANALKQINDLMKPKWDTVTDWCNSPSNLSRVKVKAVAEEIWEAARK